MSNSITIETVENGWIVSTPSVGHKTKQHVFTDSHELGKFIAEGAVAPVAPVRVYPAEPFCSPDSLFSIGDNMLNKCPYNDCGWCYAPPGVGSRDVQGACTNPELCPYKQQQQKELEDANQED